MTQAALQPFLHVANGTSTTRVVESAAIPGTVSIWADPLYEGPVPGKLSDEALVEVRARHLAAAAGQAADPVNDLRGWRSTIERYESYAELVLWFEHDLFDQLNLIQLLPWLRARVPPTKPVSLVCIGSFPGHPHFKGLGELSPDELASLFDTRQPVSEEQYVLASQAWDAFRAPTPEAMDVLRRTDTSALPYLAASLERFLQEYPATSDGLSRTERRLLQLAHGGPIRLAAAFPRMHEDEDAYFVTDTSLVELAAALARMTPPPLVLASADDSAAGPLEGSVTLTDFGRALLAGEADRVAACGIDRWLGGVHLSGQGPTWRWDGMSRTIVRQ